MNGSVCRELRRIARKECDPKKGLEVIQGSKVIKLRSGKIARARTGILRYNPRSYRALYRALKKGRCHGTN